MRLSTQRTTLALIAVLALVGSSCSGGASEHVPGQLLGRATFHTSSGPVETAFLEVANSQEERELGLMGRRRLDRNSGMVFVFGAPTTEWFWMKDTPLPLSIAFWDGTGRITDILDMEPCTTDSCTLYEPRAPYTRALEMRQGWFDEHGVQIGDRVDLTVATE